MGKNDTFNQVSNRAAYDYFDINHDGLLDFKEFLALTYERDKIFTKENLETFFTKADTNKDNLLSA